MKGGIILVDDIKKFKYKFYDIRRMGMIKSKRKGTTGAGYTFESLIGKQEDQECKPDFGSIEIKTRNAFTKSPMNLFTFNPTSLNGGYAIQDIFDNYKYLKENTNEIVFSRNVYYCKKIQKNSYSFNLFLDSEEKRLYLTSLKDNIYESKICYWDLDKLKEKVENKLQLLAVVKAYPYTRNNETYFKYLKMNLYKLKNFEKFVELIISDKIFISISLKQKENSDKKKYIDNHGCAFRIVNEAFDELFQEIDYSNQALELLEKVK